MDMPWDSMVYLISAMMVRLAASIPRVQATYIMLMSFPVFRIHDILMWIEIRIRGSMPLTNGSGSCYFRH